jgi:uncharacterized protein
VGVATIIDRRLNPRDKTIKNRQKFIQRSKEQIRRAVKEQIDQGNIADIEKGKVRVKVKGIDEPTFSIDQKTGNKRYVLPGNKDFVVGDKQDKPQGGSGTKGNEGGPGTGEDDFEFVLNHNEYLDFLFEDLELPDLVKKQVKDVTKVKPKRSGFTNTGNPSQFDILRSFKNSLGRRIGLGRPSDEQVEELENKLEIAERCRDFPLIQQLQEELEQLRKRQVTIPWFDPLDVRYRNFAQVPQPITQAVMFCVMDVSGSMGQEEKDLAKRFFFLLHTFLIRKYQKVDIVFIKHHEAAFEVDENDFFYSQESGGTIVSTAINLTNKIIKSRYNVEDWNIYVAQISDGDNWIQDRSKVTDAMHTLLPMVQYFAYVEIKAITFLSHWYGAHNQTTLWTQYKNLMKEYSHMQMREVSSVNQIWKVFKELFSKEKTK